MRYFLLLFILTVLAVVSVAGFRGRHSQRPPIELFNDMVRQNKVRPQTPSDFFPDEYNSRPYPDGTVARSGPIQTAGEVVEVGGKPVYPYEDSPLTTGRVTGTTNFVELMPVPVTRQLLERGQERFQIYCMPCHGADGDGKGITGKYGMVGMANFHDQRLVNMPDGEIFNTITHGKNNMGAYGAIVAVEDRWAVIAYVRALQRSQLGTIDDVPEALRGTLKK